LRDDVGQGRVGDRQDDDLAGDLLAGVARADGSTVFPPLRAISAMADPMLPVPMMLTCAMTFSLWNGCSDNGRMPCPANL
jgi:hypothetical protein